ncbi:hypothetical protein SCHPADRAFT_905736 [Schizopora paradoxa]|uniref:GH16 domain-containing protein n=1 Tax=Schizopora paradoxa TaxID=27342 RepID=A0A0H2RQP1_9AGAM|nr:hypothetical protein SCHPADRAFT_905736 [Schizopora paradoxa]
MISSVLSALPLLTYFLTLPTYTTATTYQLSVEYAGSNFFDGWSFFNNVDNLTNGDAVFVGESTASKSQLAFVNDNGNAIMRVDNFTNLKFGDKRDTIHITSLDLFTVGSVWVADMLHVPFGCSVWPAFWSTAPSWPVGGEIDTFEGINNVLMNRMTLHTEPGCVQTNPVQTSTLINSTDCNFQDNGNQGCDVTDPNPSSYGAAFAAAGGGVWVTEYAEAGISIWFFNRSSIPSSLQGNVTSFDVGSLGTPVANWPTGGCDMTTFFKPQNLVFDITLCGDLAGVPSVFAETCTGDCYVDWVLGSPSNFDNAYFEVASVKVFGSGQDTTILMNDSPRQVSATLWATALVALAATTALHFSPSMLRHLRI